MNFKKVFPCVLIVLCCALLSYSQTTAETNFSGVVGSGARAFGMGGAFIAIADDATAASWNPGGLGQLEMPEFSFVLRTQAYDYINPAIGDRNVFTGPQNYSGESFTFDFISFTYPFRIGGFKLVPQISYQRAISFDVENVASDVIFRAEEYDRKMQRRVYLDSVFAYEGIFEGGFDTVSFSLGAKLFKGFNIGVSTNVWMNGYEGTEYTAVAGLVRIEGSDYNELIGTEKKVEKSFDISGVNFNVGTLIEIFEGVKVGAVYRSSFKADVEYRNYAVGQTFGSNFQEVVIQQNEFTGTAELQWPATIGVGISILPEDKLTFSLDYTITYWSDSIIKNYNNAETAELAVDVYFPTLNPVNRENSRPQADTEQLRFGIEYIYIAGDDLIIPFRMGIFTDSQYFKDAAREEIRFIGLTGGLGLKYGPLAIDLALMYESGEYLPEMSAYGPTSFDEFRIYLSTIFSF